MVIGFPTDVKHVAHIGMDGPSNAPPSWVSLMQKLIGCSQITSNSQRG